MEPSTISILALIFSLITFTWSIYYNLSQNKKAHIKYVLELFNEFHSNDMIKAREITWSKYEELFSTNKNISFEKLWIIG